MTLYKVICTYPDADPTIHEGLTLNDLLALVNTFELADVAYCTIEAIK